MPDLASGVPASHATRARSPSMRVIVPQQSSVSVSRLPYFWTISGSRTTRAPTACFARIALRA